MRSTEDQRGTQTNGPRLIERALDVLTVLSGGPKTFTSVCREVGLSKATVHRILTGLTYLDFVVQNPLTGEYMLGAGSYRLGRGLGATNGGIAALTASALGRLNEETDETVVLHVRLGQRRVCVAEYDTAQPLKYVVGIGAVAPLHVGAAGKVLLAWLDEPDLRRVLPSELEKLTDATITDWAILLDELAGVRAQGWAESHGERITGAFAISAPIFDEHRNVVAAVSVLGPEARSTRARSIELRRALVATAAEASRLVGGRPYAAARSAQANDIAN